MNSISLIGNLTRDPELKQTTSSQLAKFTLAVNDGYGDAKKTYYIDCTLWGKRCSALMNYAKKGHKLAITGKLIQETWEGSDGKKSKLSVNVFDFDLLSSKQSGPSFEPIPDQGDFSVNDEDMPF